MVVEKEMGHKEGHDVCTVAICIVADKKAHLGLKKHKSEEIKPVTLTKQKLFIFSIVTGLIVEMLLVLLFIHS